ncbi:hypothetical protein [uncultured Kiloniella sp.]|uniref:hypothetical protein n=1 Tax=uncultured Kiloniella sp. TaxID=1133091 RepID=UPI002627657B|nr:hypothetical protein [uncultured Kiloniella sp.]
MSLITWTSDELKSEIITFSPHEVWRVVEAQHVVSTIKLVDDLEEQQLLEEIQEDVKPVLQPELKDFHYLLALKLSRSN